jgi:hypothetical protein
MKKALRGIRMAKFTALLRMTFCICLKKPDKNPGIKSSPYKILNGGLPRL